MLFAHDSDWWNSAMLVCLAIAAIAAVGVVITTLAVVRAQKIEARVASDELERYKAAVALKVAEAQKEGVEAGKAAAAADLRAAEAHKQAAEANERAAAARKGAAEADARAAKANERAATLEKEAEVARLEQERLKQNLAWRALSTAQGNTLVAALRAHSGTVRLWYTYGDPESLLLAIQIGDALSQAHWQVSFAAVTMAGTIVWDIALPDANGDDAQALRGALTTAHIAFHTDPIPQPAMMLGDNTRQNAPILMIGSRKPTIFR